MKVKSVNQKFISLRDVPKYIGIPYGTFSNNYQTWFSDLDLKIYKKGKHVLFKTQDLDRLVESWAVN